MARTTINKLHYNVCQNKYVFSFHLNTLSDEADVMSSRKLLHSFGPAEANDRSPIEIRCNGETVS